MSERIIRHPYRLSPPHMMLVMRLTLKGADPNFVKDKEVTPLS